MKRLFLPMWLCTAIGRTGSRVKREAVTRFELSISLVNLVCKYDKGVLGYIYCYMCLR